MTMCANKFEKSEKYSGAREAFDELGVEEKAVFIVESAINMVVQGVKDAGDAFAEAFDRGTESEEEVEPTVDEQAPKEKARSRSKSGTKSKKTGGTGKKKSPEKDTEE